MVWVIFQQLWFSPRALPSGDLSKRSRRGPGVSPVGLAPTPSEALGDTGSKPLTRHPRPLAFFISALGKLRAVLRLFQAPFTYLTRIFFAGMLNSTFWPLLSRPLGQGSRFLHPVWSFFSSDFGGIQWPMEPEPGLWSSRLVLAGLPSAIWRRYPHMTESLWLLGTMWLCLRCLFSEH